MIICEKMTDLIQNTTRTATFAILEIEHAKQCDKALQNFEFGAVHRCAKLVHLEKS